VVRSRSRSRFFSQGPDRDFGPGRASARQGSRVSSVANAQAAEGFGGFWESPIGAEGRLGSCAPLAAAVGPRAKPEGFESIAQPIRHPSPAPGCSMRVPYSRLHESRSSAGLSVLGPPPAGKSGVYRVSICATRSAETLWLFTLGWLRIGQAGDLFSSALDGERQHALAWLSSAEQPGASTILQRKNCCFFWPAHGRLGRGHDSMTHFLNLQRPATSEQRSGPQRNRTADCMPIFT